MDYPTVKTYMPKEYTEYFIQYFRNLIVIAWASIIFGIILFFADKAKNIHKNWEDLSFYEVIIIGFFQSLAFIPGASRAGVTITGARLLGFSRQSAAIYSMLLSIPIIIASFILALPNFIDQSKNIFNLNQILVSSIISFIVALLSIKFMMLLVKNYTYNLFVIYA